MVLLIISLSISSNAQYYYTGTSLLEFDEAGTNLTSKDIQVVDVVARGSVAETGYSSTQDLFDIENYAIGMVASGGFDLGPFYVPGLLHDAVKAIVKSAVPPDGLSYNDPSNAYMKFYNSGNSSVTVTIKQSWHSDFSTIQTAVIAFANRNYCYFKQCN